MMAVCRPVVIDNIMQIKQPNQKLRGENSISKFSVWCSLWEPNHASLKCHLNVFFGKRN